MKARELFTLTISTSFFYALVELVPTFRVLVIGLALMSMLISARESSDKALLFAVAVLGLAPCLGWIGAVNSAIDVVTLISAATISCTVFHVVRRKIRFNLYLIPATIAGAATYQWWRPILNGSNSDVLARLLGGWDHFGHFYLMISAKVHHKFVALLPDSIPNTTLYDKKYPAGIHMSWSQWWRDMGDDLLNHPSMALHQYLRSVVITVALCIALITIAVARFATKKWMRVLFVSSASILFTAFICFGHLSMAIWSGFPNFIVAITGAVIVISIAMKPNHSPWNSLLLIAGGSAMTTYNWYPLLVPIAPIALYSLFKATNSLAKRTKVFYYAILVFLGVVIALPVLQALSLGAQHLAVPGGINNLPAQTIVMVLLIGACFGLFRLSKDFSFSGVISASPLIIPSIFQLLVTIPIRLRDGTYPYYPQKIAYGMVFIVLAAICMTIVRWFEIQWQEKSRRLKFTQATAVFIATFAFSQLFGYVGFDWATAAPANSAPGIQARELMIANSASKHRIAAILLGIEEAVQDESLISKDCLMLDDTEVQDYDPVLVNYWVGTLTWTLTEEHIKKSQEIIPIRTGTNDPESNAKVLGELLKSTIDCPVVTRPVARSLIKLNSEWAHRIWVIESDGNVTNFASKD